MGLEYKYAWSGVQPVSMLDSTYKYIWAFYVAFHTGFHMYTKNLELARERCSPVDVVFFDTTDNEIRYNDLSEDEQAQLDQVFIDNGVVRMPKIGDRVRIHLQGFRVRTPVWAEGYCGTVVKLNPKTIGVKLDAYPHEIQKIDYGDYDFLDV